jgi:hypothetical protein
LVNKPRQHVTLHYCAQALIYFAKFALCPIVLLSVITQSVPRCLNLSMRRSVKSFLSSIPLLATPHKNQAQGDDTTAADRLIGFGYLRRAAPEMQQIQHGIYWATHVDMVFALTYLETGEIGTVREVKAATLSHNALQAATTTQNRSISDPNVSTQCQHSSEPTA